MSKFCALPSRFSRFAAVLTLGFLAGSPGLSPPRSSSAGMETGMGPWT
jgi:hypothetical protein